MFAVVMVFEDGLEDVVCRVYEKSMARIIAWSLSEWYTNESWVVAREDGSEVCRFRSGEEIDVDEDEETGRSKVERLHGRTG